MMCKYCNPDNQYLDDDEYFPTMLSHRELKGEVYEGLDLVVADKALFVTTVAPIKVGYVVAHTAFEKKVEINFCPMCGRKL